MARSAEDGVVEALEFIPGGAGLSVFHVEQLPADEQPFMLGVQWHPERSWDLSATSRNLFERLIVSARAHHLRSSTAQAGSVEAHQVRRKDESSLVLSGK